MGWIDECRSTCWSLNAAVLPDSYLTPLGHFNGLNTAPEGGEDDLLLAARLMWACYYLYYSAPSGIAYDSVNFIVRMTSAGRVMGVFAALLHQAYQLVVHANIPTIRYLDFIPRPVRAGSLSVTAAAPTHHDTSITQNDH